MITMARKSINLHMKNPEGSLKLTLRGKNCKEIALKIGDIFEEACKEVRKSNDSTK